MCWLYSCYSPSATNPVPPPSNTYQENPMKNHAYRALAVATVATFCQLPQANAADDEAFTLAGKRKAEPREEFVDPLSAERRTENARHARAGWPRCRNELARPAATRIAASSSPIA